jgi:hypothetical protein
MKKTIPFILSICFFAAFFSSFMHNINTPVILFLDSLNEKQLQTISHSFDDSQRTTWHFLPAKSWPREGISLKKLDNNQKELFSKMLQTFLSKAGYSKTQKIIDLENVLAIIDKDPEYRDPEKYYISIFGNPRTDSLWAWSFEGHHISLNFTILDNQLISTPRFFGANPATIPIGERKGERTLIEEEDLAYALMESLSKQQLKQTIFREEAFIEIISVNSSEVQPLEPVGIKAIELNDAQQTILKDIINVYLSTQVEKIASEREKKILEEEFGDIRFGWAGSLDRSEGHYYRIQGKTFLIEFDNTQTNANHIHTVWRDFNGDFGRDLIKEHYHHADHHKHD